jgi:broad specificity phosphatase PhoE
LLVVKSPAIQKNKSAIELGNPKMYVIRHGQTVWNRARIIQGQQQSVLTRDGIAQADAMGRTLATHLDQRGLSAGDMQMISSPLARSYQTASVIAENIGYDPVAIHRDDRLKEIGFGQWETRAWAEIEKTEAPEVEKWLAERFSYRPPGGENYPDVMARLQYWLNSLQARENLIVVAHGVVNQILRGMHAALPGEEIPGLDFPQDAFYRLTDEGIERIETDFG